MGYRCTTYLWIPLLLLQCLLRHPNIIYARARPLQQQSMPQGTKVGDLNIWAGMIYTDPITAGIMGRDFNRVPQGVNGTAQQNAFRRIRHAENMTAQLPFPVQKWWSVYVSSCPSRMNKGNDRGVMMAHYQIWADFVYQGRLGSDKEVAKDSDVLIVFEDDAVIAVRDIKHSIQQALAAMNKDLMYFGWCYGRRHVPMCMHAYGITRGATKKVVELWDICSSDAIDSQIKALAMDGTISWQKAPEESYADLKPGFFDNPAYFTRGLFVQKKGFVSFNHHGFQNNAG